MINANGEKPEFWVYLPVLDTQVIAVGDICWWDSSLAGVGGLKRASDFTWDTDAATTRKKFKQFYVGISGAAHFSGDGTKLHKVCITGKFQSDIDSGASDIGTLVGPDDASSLLMNQKLTQVSDPLEGIGQTCRTYLAGAQTIMEVFLSSSLAIPDGSAGGQITTFQMPIVINATGVDWITAGNVGELFGGTVELLSASFIEAVAVTTNPFVFRFQRNADTVLATALTVPTSGAAIGRVTTQSFTGIAVALRTFKPQDTITLDQNGTAPATGSGTLVLRFRLLAD